MMLRLFLLLLFLVSSKVDVLACLLSEQLLKMQEEELGQITYFLKNENWSLESTRNGVRFSIEDHFVNRDVASWNGRYSESVEVYFFQGKSNIVRYATDGNCFNELIHNFKKLASPRNEILGQSLYTKFKIESRSLLFIETPNSNGYNSYEVVIYNTGEIQQEVKIAKQKEAAYLEKLKEAESLFAREDFTGAELKYYELNALQKSDASVYYDCLSVDEYNERLAKCRIEICKKIIRAAEDLAVNGSLKAAVSELTEAKSCLEGPNLNAYAISERAHVDRRIKELKLEDRLIEARLFQERGNLEDALMALDEAAILSNYRRDIEEARSKLAARITDNKTQALLDEAAVLIKSMEYERAIANLDKALELNKGDKRIATLRDDAAKQWKSYLSENYLKAADRLYTEQKYRDAITEYKSYLELNPKNAYAMDRISSATGILEILDMRAMKTFKYSDVNKGDYEAFTRELIGNLNAAVDTQDKGEFRFETNIVFDTSGVNHSKPSIAVSSSALFGEVLFSMHGTSILTAPQKAGYYLAAEDHAEYDLSWTSDKIVLHSRPSGIFSSTGNSEMLVKECVEFIGKAPYSFGASSFTVREKRFNGKIYRDIHFDSYRSAGTMSAACASFVVPGLGSVLTGKKARGYIAMSGFFASAGLAYMAERKSNSKYEAYMEATNQDDIDQLYKSANRWHHRSITFASVAIGVYVYDVFGALVSGRENAIKSWGLKRRVNREYVRREPLKL